MEEISFLTETLAKGVVLAVELKSISSLLHSQYAVTESYIEPTNSSLQLLYYLPSEQCSTWTSQYVVTLVAIPILLRENPLMTQMTPNGNWRCTGQSS
jgi:hypothetical protein